jgi:hypothetical protein
VVRILVARRARRGAGQPAVDERAPHRLPRHRTALDRAPPTIAKNPAVQRRAMPVGRDPRPALPGSTRTACGTRSARVEARRCGHRRPAAAAGLDLAADAAPPQGRRDETNAYVRLSDTFPIDPAELRRTSRWHTHRRRSRRHGGRVTGQGACGPARRNRIRADGTRIETVSARDAFTRAVDGRKIFAISDLVNPPAQ